MHEWVDYIKNNCGENGLWQTGFLYGDWLALDKEESADRTGATDKSILQITKIIWLQDLREHLISVKLIRINLEKNIRYSCP